MRQVRCKDNNELVSSADAYKAPDGKYYSSKGAFDHLVKEREFRQKCLLELGNILGYRDGMRFPTIVAKKLKEYESYGYEVVLTTILNKKPDMVYMLSHKDFTSDYNRTAYIMAIITNSINDTLNKTLKKNSTLKIDNTVATAEEVESMKSSPSVGEVHDISRFL